MNLVAAQTAAPTATVLVLPWLDPVVERVGHTPASEYVELFWLPVLGPSSVLLLRYLGRAFDVAPEGFELDLDTCARSLGLGGGLGKWGPIQRTLTRCATFGMARRWGEDRILVRRKLPPLSRHHQAHLPDPLQLRHQAWLDEELGRVAERRSTQPPRAVNALTTSVHRRTP